MGYSEDTAKSKIADNMKILIEQSSERHIPSVVAVGRSEFRRLGLTDAALLELSSREIDRQIPTLLTVDLDLAVAPEMRGYNVHNFNHYR
jgi:hypothetical protein